MTKNCIEFLCVKLKLMCTKGLATHPDFVLPYKSWRI
jgi:hypothetical protein